MSSAFLHFLSLIFARTAIIALFLIVGLRLLGKRQLGQMNIYDLAMIMALANAVQNAMTSGGGDISVGIVSAGALLIVGLLFTFLFVRLPKLEERVVGSPTVLLNDGYLLPERMRREHVTKEELMTALRQHGLTDPKQALTAVLEVDGSISVVPNTAPHHRMHRKKKRGKAQAGQEAKENAAGSSDEERRGR